MSISYRGLLPDLLISGTHLILEGIHFSALTNECSREGMNHTHITQLLMLCEPVHSTDQHCK